MNEEENTGTKQLFSYNEDASRLELFVRIVYGFLISIVLAIYGFIASLCMFVQWFHILILGRRNLGLHDIVQGYLEYQTHVLSYTNFTTDERPGIMPVKANIFERRI